MRIRMYRPCSPRLEVYVACALAYRPLDYEADRSDCRSGVFAAFQNSGRNWRGLVILCIRALKLLDGARKSLG